MRWPWVPRKPSADLEHARRERQRAEEQLSHAREYLIIPLREIRRANHIQDDISRAIRQRLERGGA